MLQTVVRTSVSQSNMKICSFTISAVVSSFLFRGASPFTSHHTLLSSHQQRQFYSRNTTPLAATVVQGENDLASLMNKDKLGKEIAEGTVVSRQGGLTAVHVNVNSVPTNDDTPAVLDPNLPPSKASDAKKSSISAAGDLLGRHVILPNGDISVVVCHRPPLVFCYNENSETELTDGTAKVLDSIMSVNVPELPDFDHAMFSPIPQVKDIALINNPMLTGITMIDALAPIGRGQNMLLVGHDDNDMRGLATDFMQQLLKGKDSKVTCVYAAIDESDIRKRLQVAGIEDQVHLIESSGDKDPRSKSAQAVAVAASACAVAESFALAEPYCHTVVVVDSIDQHKLLWDTTTRVLVDVFGVDSVVRSDQNGAASSEMRAFYSSLIQRAGQFNNKNGGGSVTLLLLTKVPKTTNDENTVFDVADFEGSSDKVKDRINLLVSRKIPLTAANLQKIDIPIPSEAEGRRRLVLQHIDDLISMSDGQIWLDEELQAQGQEPPLDPQRSITRVGIGADTQSRADAPALRRIVERLRLDLSQAVDMDGANMETEASKAQLRRKNALLLAMHQPAGAGGRRLSQSCVALLAASEGYLDSTVDGGALAGTAEGKRVMQGLLGYVDEQEPDAMIEIDDTLDTRPEIRELLTETIAQYFE